MHIHANLGKFGCGVKGCTHVTFTRVGCNQMRLRKGVQWELRCKRHTPRWLVKLTHELNARALAEGKITLELEAWREHGHMRANMPR